MRHAAPNARSPRTHRWWGAVFSFIAAVALFGVMLLFPHHEASEPPSKAAGEYHPPRTVLLFIHDGGGRLTTAVVVRVDGSVTVTGYPKQTEVVYGTALRPLSVCYEREGADAAAQLAEHTGGDCDVVLRLSVEAVASLADRLGNGIVMDGELVTGYRMRELLCDEGETMTAQAEMTARCVAAILDRYLTPKQDLEKAFRLLSALCDDRLIAAQFLSVKEELERLAASNQGALCTVKVPTGYVVGVGDEQRFVLQTSGT